MAKKLMIVDDRAISRRLVRQAAASPLDTVLECASPEEALKALSTFKPDCVMLGMSCPPPGALHAIKIIRQRHPEMRVLAISTFNEAETREAARAAGASGYATGENLSELFLLAAPERLVDRPVSYCLPRGHKRKNN